jgi:hypothetical protein
MGNVANHELLAAALVGYRSQLHDIQSKIDSLQARLGGKAGPKALDSKPKRTISAAARKRIAAAQKKRWASYRKTKEASAVSA